MAKQTIKIHVLFFEPIHSSFLTIMQANNTLKPKVNKRIPIQQKSIQFCGSKFLQHFFCNWSPLTAWRTAAIRPAVLAIFWAENIFAGCGTVGCKTVVAIAVVDESCCCCWDFYLSQNMIFVVQICRFSTYCRNIRLLSRILWRYIALQRVVPIHKRVVPIRRMISF